MKKYRTLKYLYRLMEPYFDPIKAWKGVVASPRYFIEWRRYAHMPHAEKLHIADAYPQLHDRTINTLVEPHYFYLNGWAIRRILDQHPEQHVDIGSSIMFVNMLSAVLPVAFVDYRALKAKISGLNNISGDIQHLAFRDNSLSSLSCLHVAEHIGLGRYGDSLDPRGTRQACAQLTRVLAKGGNLYFALPVGRPRVCFNAHRIHSPETIVDYFAELELLEYSGVHDNGYFAEHVELNEFKESEYACGMFWFKKK